MEFVKLPEEEEVDLPDDIKIELLGIIAEQKKQMKEFEEQRRREINELVRRQDEALGEFSMRVQLRNVGFGFYDEEINEARTELNNLTSQLENLQLNLSAKTPDELMKESQRLIKLQKLLAQRQQMNYNRFIRN